MLSKKTVKTQFSRKSLSTPENYNTTFFVRKLMINLILMILNSIFLKPDINERFVDACENGDLNTVNIILEKIKDFNTEITDNLGQTALRLAVENEHLDVIFF